MKISKLKNPYFWMGIVALIFSTAGVDMATLTSWKLLGESLWSILNNPVVLFWIFANILSVWNDNSTPGIDKISMKRKVNKGHQMKLISKCNVEIDENLNKKDYTNFYAKTKLGVNTFYKKGFTGKNTTIAIIDTGCDINHPILKKNIVGVRNFTNEDDSKTVTDYNGHGTHVAGIIKSVAKDANLLILKVLESDGDGDYDWIIKAINYAIDQKVDIINMSLGGEIEDDDLYKAIKRAIDNDILVVCAAGNEGDGNEDTKEESFPGAYNEVIEVGAIDKNKCMTDFSNSNKNVDIVSYGDDIISTLPDGKYGMMSGTSQATPYVSGALALIKEHSEYEFDRKLNESELYAQLIKHTKTLKNVGRTEQGNGYLYLK